MRAPRTENVLECCGAATFFDLKPVPFDGPSSADLLRTATKDRCVGAPEISYVDYSGC